MDIIAEGNYTAWWDKITDQYADESLRTDVKLIVRMTISRLKSKKVCMEEVPLFLANLFLFLPRGLPHSKISKVQVCILIVNVAKINLLHPSTKVINQNKVLKGE